MESAHSIPPLPLGLYIHLPWCLHKCAYCDFNSHATQANAFPEKQYTEKLITDLSLAAPTIAQRPVQSIFIGGGTPSLFSPESIDAILTACKQHTYVASDCEITLETNPSTFEFQKFSEFFHCGVNRISVGAQSFNNIYLTALGRIHNASEAMTALETAHKIGFSNINVDLMFGLPEQTFDDAINDVKIACQQAVNHISYYQLTLEPNTIFHRFPPKLPTEDISWEIQTQGIQTLEEAGYQRYEVSAYSYQDAMCIHNTNYWRYGDYLGIGAGAHSKITTSEGVIRHQRTRQPDSYISAVDKQSHILNSHTVTSDDRVFEFMLNNLRLVKGFTIDTFSKSTGISWLNIEQKIEQFIHEGLLVKEGSNIKASTLGYQFLDELTEKFLPNPVCS